MIKSHKTLMQERQDRAEAACKRLQEIERLEPYDEDAFYVCLCGTAGIDCLQHREECEHIAKSKSDTLFIWRCRRELRFFGRGVGYSGYVPVLCNMEDPEFFIPWKEATVTAACTRCGALNEYDSLDPRLGTDYVQCAGRGDGKCGGLYPAKGANAPTHLGHHLSIIAGHDSENPPGFVRCFGWCDDCFGPAGKDRGSLYIDFHPGFDRDKHIAHHIQLAAEIEPSRYRAICTCHRVFDVRISDVPPEPAS